MHLKRAKAGGTLFSMPSTTSHPTKETFRQDDLKNASLDMKSNPYSTVQYLAVI